MEVLFVDVGFGTCSLILTGSGEAIVIDAGKRSQEPLTLLNHFSVSRIRHLIVSHWHHDHIGGAAGLLRAYGERIGTVWFPFDSAFRETEFWKSLLIAMDAGILGPNQVKPLMLQGSNAKQIWASTVRDADLQIVSPCFMENMQGAAAEDSNATCGVLILRVGTRLIVFAGDATLAQWQQVGKRVRVPMSAEVLAVPHHAGIIWPDAWAPAQVATALDNLYTKIVRPKVAVISTGTRPGKKHPREDVVAALRRANADVMCTQMTRRCTSDLEATRRIRASLPVLAPGRSSTTLVNTKSNHSNHVACAGSVVVELLASGVTIHQLAAHQAFVGRIPNRQGKLPMCRR